MTIRCWHWHIDYMSHIADLWSDYINCRQVAHYDQNYSKHNLHPVTISP